MLWSRGPLIVRLLLLLALSEAVRSGFFVAYLPLQDRMLGLGAAVIGLLVGGHYLADGLAKGPAGVLAERWGMGRLAVIGAGLGLVVLLVLPRLPWIWLGLLLSLLWGLALASLWPSVMTAVSHHAQPGRAARALGVASVVVAPGVAVGALGTGLLMERAPELAGNVLLGAQGLAVLLALSVLRLRLPRSVAPLRHFRWRPLTVLLPGAFAQTLAPGLLVITALPYLQLRGLSVADLLLPGLLAAAVGLPTLLLLGRLADRWHPKWALLPGLTLLAGAFVLLAQPDLGERLLPSAALLGAAVGAFLSGWNGLVARTLPKDHRAAAWGTIMAVEALGYAAGPPLGGLAWQYIGPQAPFLLGAGVLGLTTLYYLVARERAPQPA